MDPWPDVTRSEQRCQRAASRLAGSRFGWRLACFDEIGAGTMRFDLNRLIQPAPGLAIGLGAASDQSD